MSASEQKTKPVVREDWFRIHKLDIVIQSILAVLRGEMKPGHARTLIEKVAEAEKKITAGQKQG